MSGKPRARKLKSRPEGSAGGKQNKRLFPFFRSFQKTQKAISTKSKVSLANDNFFSPIANNSRRILSQERTELILPQ